MRLSKSFSLGLMRVFFILAVATVSFFNVLDIRRASAACTINGQVYVDYNNNGVKDALEPGQGGVQVSYYFDVGGDGLSELLGSANTIATNVAATDGTYSLAAAGVPDPAEVRVEFSQIPDFLRSGRFGTGNASTTTITFVNCAGNGTVNGIDLALSEPGVYCHTNNPDLGTSCYVQDNQFDPLIANDTTFASFPFASSGSVPTTPDFPLATAQQIGTTWGLAYHRSTDSFLVGAFMKRHAGFGPGGPGAIYRMQNASARTAASATLFTTISGTGTDPHPVAAPACGQPTLTLCWQVDPGAFNVVGKSSIGDMDMSADDRTLYIVNLFQREIVELTIGITGTPGASVRRSLVNLPGTSGGATGCPNAGDVWPFGLGVHAGRVYVGSVCTAETSQNRADLRAYVHSYDALNPGLGFRLDLSFPLNYPRRCVNAAPACVPSRDADWQPWSNTWPTPNSGFVIRPEPWLTDIAFDNDHMILGFRDRFADRAGNGRPGPNDDPTNLALFAYGVPAGDILRACWDDVTATYTLESEGACGGIDTNGGNVGQGPTAPGDEYYFTDSNNPAGVPIHDEVVVGGLVTLPGTNVVAATVYDPLLPNTFPGDNGLEDAGVIWFNNTTGGRDHQYRLINGGLPVPGGPPTTFGKANAVGDLEAICGSEPLEIGNRVWEDLDRDGVQDPTEVKLANVIVNLYMDSDNNGSIDLLVGTTTTDANGEYYFNETNVTGATANVFFDDINGNGTQDPHEPTGVLARRTYEVRLDDPANYGAGAPLDLYYITTTDRDPLADGNGDSRDNDGTNTAPTSLVSATNFAVKRVTTGDYGDNNHTYDFGFARNPPLTTPTPTPGNPGGPISSNGFTLTKTADKPFAGPGVIVTWTLTITNPNGIPLTNVQVIDVVPSQLEIIPPVTDTSATGTTSISGQTVTFDQATMAPNETVQVYIKTRVRGTVQPPFIIVNEANGTCCQGFAVSPPAQAQILSVNRLPATGDSWFGQFRLPLLLTLVSLGLMLVMRFSSPLMSRKAQTTRR